MSINIRPPALMATGDEMAASGGSARYSVSRCLESSKTVAGAYLAWQSSVPLELCAQAWEDHLRDLAGQLQKLGEQLVASADDYASADDEAERRILAVFALLSKS